MENHQVDGDVSVDKGKRVVSEFDASDSKYEPDCECSEYDTLVDSDYESEYDDMLYDSYVDNEAEWTEGNQGEVSQGGESQAAVIQAGVSQPAVSQSNVSQGGGSQAAVKGRSCFEQVVCVVNNIYRDLWICPNSAVAFLHW
ncbi:unnamed protein product [Ilex paraguariensis]|uniref:Uncharacterized protein n=1 Tax=Ilex paraguariensis TaxID=185542 RepID=A0ABC8U1F7_9AQUA